MRTSEASRGDKNVKSSPFVASLKHTWAENVGHHGGQARAEFS